MGANDNQEYVGRQERGRDPGSYWAHEETDEEGNTIWEYAVSYSEVILSPDGEHLLAMVPMPGPGLGWAEPGMVLAVKDLPDGDVHVVPEVQDISRLNFSPTGGEAYALSGDGLTVQVVSLAEFKVTKKILLGSRFGVVDVTPDRKFLVLTNLPTTDFEETWATPSDSCLDPNDWSSSYVMNRCAFAVVTLNTGDVRVEYMERPLRDLDFSPVNGELLLTSSTWKDAGHEYVPEATMSFYDPATGTFVGSTSFPNCGDEVVLDRTRNLALLSPTHCSPPKHPSQQQPPPPNKDPISVVDLETRSFVKNLPGFGPVVLSETGGLAIGFTRRQALIAEWNYFGQDTAAGLIFVNLDTLDWSTMDFGEVEPTYTLSPDGKRLYVYVEGYSWEEGTDGTWGLTGNNEGIRELDVMSRQWTPISQEPMKLDRFVWTKDGGSLWFLSHTNLYRLDAESRELKQVPVLDSPNNMNLRPQQDYLVLGEAEAPDFQLVDLELAAVLDAFSMEAPPQLDGPELR
jgi:WD40 repeat protein